MGVKVPLSELVIKGNFLKLMKLSTEKSYKRTILNHEMLKAFTLWQNKTHLPAITPSSHCCTVCPWQCSKVRKKLRADTEENKNNWTLQICLALFWEGVTMTILFSFWHIFILLFMSPEVSSMQAKWNIWGKI